MDGGARSVLVSCVVLSLCSWPSLGPASARPEFAELPQPTPRIQHKRASELLPTLLEANATAAGNPSYSSSSTAACGERVGALAPRSRYVRGQAVSSELTEQVFCHEACECLDHLVRGLEAARVSKSLDPSLVEWAHTLRGASGFVEPLFEGWAGELEEWLESGPFEVTQGERWIGLLKLAEHSLGCGTLANQPRPSLGVYLNAFRNTFGAEKDFDVQVASAKAVEAFPVTAAFGRALVEVLANTRRYAHRFVHIEAILVGGDKTSTLSDIVSATSLRVVISNDFALARNHSRQGRGLKLAQDALSKGRVAIKTKAHGPLWVHELSIEVALDCDAA